jgi:hypothetical protein
MTPPAGLLDSRADDAPIVRKRPSTAGRRSERLQVQFQFRVDKSAFASRSEAEAAIKRAKEEMVIGADPDAVPGVHVIIRWRNPDNQNPKHADWKTSDDAGQSPEGAVRTLAGMMR